MSRYIDADKAIEIWKDQDYIKLSSQEVKARIMLDAVPSADIVEVVRCKDCKWAEVHKKDNGVFCEYNECGFEKNDYCSYGERKDNEDK